MVNTFLLIPLLVGDVRSWGRERKNGNHRTEKMYIDYDYDHDSQTLASNLNYGMMKSPLGLIHFELHLQKTNMVHLKIAPLKKENRI